MNWLVVASALAILTTSSPAGAQTSAPYAFRGITLGMTLNQFRNLRYPDAPKTGPAPQAQCSNDNVKSVIGLYAPDGVARQVGAINCAFVEKGAGGFPTMLGLDFGGLGKFKTLFKFIPLPSEKEARLASIEMTASGVQQGPVVSFLEQTYGPPAPAGKGITTRTGLTLPDETVEWRNANSSITVRKTRAGQQSQRVVFEYAPLIKIELDAQATNIRAGAGVR